MHMVTETRQLRDGEKLTKFYNGKYLKAPLKNGGYSFEERKAFWDSFFDFKAPKLRLPVKIAKRSGCKL